MSNNPEVINSNSITYCDIIDQVIVLKKQLIQFYNNDKDIELKDTMKKLINYLENNTTINTTGETLENNTEWEYIYNVYDNFGTRLFSYHLRYDVFNPYKYNELIEMEVFDLVDFNNIEIVPNQYETNIIFTSIDNGRVITSKYVSNT
jgi:hypothetical protein